MENSPKPANIQEIPLIPARILNEFIYCPRLAYLEWIHAEFADNASTVDGSINPNRGVTGGRQFFV